MQRNNWRNKLCCLCIPAEVSLVWPFWNGGTGIVLFWSCSESVPVNDGNGGVLNVLFFGCFESGPVNAA